MDARLLARADADRLSVDGVADGVGLGVFQRDEGEQEVAAGLGGDVLVRRRTLGEAVSVICTLLRCCSKVTPYTSLRSRAGGV